LITIIISGDALHCTIFSSLPLFNSFTANYLLQIGSRISSAYVIPSHVRPCFKPKQNKMQNCSKTKTLCQQTFPEFNLLLISPRTQFWFVSAAPKYMNVATFH
jgi:hypothetical protein